MRGNRGLLSRLAVAGAAVALLVPAVALIRPSEPGIGAADARAAALVWTGGGSASAPRRDGEEWEVDVRREDGSLIEVTLGPGLTLRDLDEERGPRDSAAPDELRGPARGRALAAARAAAGAGEVRYAEREPEDGVEVGLLRPDGTAVEVELDPRDLTVREIEAESLDDE